MAWRDVLVRNFGPGLMGGVTFRSWLKSLRENRFSITPSCWYRALTISWMSGQNSLFHWLDRRRFGSDIEQTEVPPPLFVLGHWRQGTTHLHNLLTLDERYAFPNNYHVSFPNSFLTAEKLQLRTLDFFLPRRRPMDNVEWSMSSPQEEEFALCLTTLMSPYMGWVFPNRRNDYDRYLTLRDVSADELEEWQSALVLVLKKLTWKLRKPLILKSPPNTCRIRLLLELFPDAKFIHIHRNPYDVFPSYKRTCEVNFEWHRLQRTRPDELDEWILRQYREMYRVFFEERDLIPAGNFHEVAYEELERDPIGQVQRVYEVLSLPDFSEAQPALESYVSSIADYQKNRFSELSPELRQRIADEWGKCFDEWGYPI